MTDNTSQVPPGVQEPEATGMPVRLVRGAASPEELAAIVAILATASGDGAPDPTDRRTSRWSSPGRMVRSPLSHGPGGWRASAFPR